MLWQYRHSNASTFTEFYMYMKTVISSLWSGRLGFRFAQTHDPYDHVGPECTFPKYERKTAMAQHLDHNENLDGESCT